MEVVTNMAISQFMIVILAMLNIYLNLCGITTYLAS